MKLHQSASTKKGFTLVEMLFVLAIITLLVSLAYPHFLNSRDSARKNACVNNLRVIQAAKAQLALERGDYCCGATIPSAADLSRYIYGGANSLKCPSAPSSWIFFTQFYAVGKFCQPPTCNSSGATHFLADVVDPCPGASASPTASPSAIP